MRLPLYFWFVCLIPHSFANAQGLQFEGNDKLIDQRTSYEVFQAGKVPAFTGKFTIRFEIALLDFDHFGYIFRLKNEFQPGQIFSFTYSYKNSRSSALNFNSEGRKNLAAIPLDNRNLGRGHWLPIQMDFDPAKNEILLRAANQAFRIPAPNLGKQFRPVLFFGKNEHIVDVPQFAIRNLGIYSSNQQFVFDLREKKGNQVHDQSGNAYGRVNNPIWLINHSYNWKPVFSLRTSGVSLVNFDPSTQNFVVVGPDSLTLLNTRSNAMLTTRFDREPPLQLRLGNSFVHPGSHRLFAYEVNNLPQGETTVATLDLNSYKWSAFSDRFLPMQLHHHTGFVDTLRNRYLVFGGFGNQRYNGKLLSMDLESGKWDTLTVAGDKIAPRFFTSSVYSATRDLLYLFGGTGNESGDQSVGKRYFYDCYEIDLKTLHARRLWEVPSLRPDKVPVRNLVLTDDARHFYALAYAEHIPKSFLKLYKFSLTDGHSEVLGDSIPILSEKIETNANLYWNRPSNELFCSVQEFNNDGSNQIRIYSISNPPVSLAAISNVQPYSGSNKVAWMLFAGVLLLGTAAGVWATRHKKRRLSPSTPKSVESRMLPETPRESAIYLFGDFRVFDRRGFDVTHLFSSRLKQTFLLILQHSGEKGVTSGKMTEVIWPDKDEKSVKNIRGVTLNHLRKILADIEGLELVHEKGYFKLLFSEPCFCDYLSFYQLSTDSNSTAVWPEIVARGKFLEGTDFAEADHFKETVEERILSGLSALSAGSQQSNEFSEVIRLSEIMLLHDPLNEQAIASLIHASARINQPETGRRRYFLFTEEYKKRMNEPYPISYKDLLRNKRTLE